MCVWRTADPACSKFFVSHHFNRRSSYIQHFYLVYIAQGIQEKSAHVHCSTIAPIDNTSVGDATGGLNRLLYYFSRCWKRNTNSMWATSHQECHYLLGCGRSFSLRRLFFSEEINFPSERAGGGIV